MLFPNSHIKRHEQKTQYTAFEIETNKMSDVCIIRIIYYYEFTTSGKMEQTVILKVTEY